MSTDYLVELVLVLRFTITIKPWINLFPDMPETTYSDEAHEADDANESASSSGTEILRGNCSCQVYCLFRSGSIVILGKANHRIPYPWYVSNESYSGDDIKPEVESVEVFILTYSIQHDFDRENH